MMKLMFARLLLIFLISIQFLSWSKSDKIPYAEFHKAFMSYKTPIDLNDYRNVFIMHIGFCASTNYCNEKMVDYIAEKKSGRNLVIVDMEDIKYKQLLLQIEGIELMYVDRPYLEKNAVFSVYNLHIKKKRVNYLY